MSGKIPLLHGRELRYLGDMLECVTRRGGEIQELNQDIPQNGFSYFSIFFPKVQCAVCIAEIIFTFACMYANILNKRN